MQRFALAIGALAFKREFAPQRNVVFSFAVGTEARTQRRGIALAVALSRLRVAL